MEEPRPTRRDHPHSSSSSATGQGRKFASAHTAQRDRSRTKEGGVDLRVVYGVWSRAFCIAMQNSCASRNTERVNRTARDTRSHWGWLFRAVPRYTPRLSTLVTSPHGVLTNRSTRPPGRSCIGSKGAAAAAARQRAAGRPVRLRLSRSRRARRLLLCRLRSRIFMPPGCASLPEGGCLCEFTAKVFSQWWPKITKISEP